MKDRQKLRALLFALSALPLLLCIIVFTYESAYQLGYDAHGREPITYTIKRSPRYTGDIQTSIYHGDWCTHTVDPYDAVYFDKIDVAEALGYESCEFF